MSYDLALGVNNDLVFSASGDLLGISGRPIFEQRIKTRLKIRRASWVYDTDGTLGSRLDLALGRSVEQALTEITAFVHEALDEMTDISVSKVDVIEPTDEAASMLTVVIGYQVLVSPEEAPFLAPDEQTQEIEVTFDF